MSYSVLFVHLFLKAIACFILTFSDLAGHRCLWKCLGTASCQEAGHSRRFSCEFLPFQLKILKFKNFKRGIPVAPEVCEPVCAPPTCQTSCRPVNPGKCVQAWLHLPTLFKSCAATNHEFSLNSIIFYHAVCLFRALPTEMRSPALCGDLSQS